MGSLGCPPGSVQTSPWQWLLMLWAVAKTASIHLHEGGGVVGQPQIGKHRWACIWPFLANIITLALLAVFSRISAKFVSWILVQLKGEILPLVSCTMTKPPHFYIPLGVYRVGLVDIYPKSHDDVGSIDMGIIVSICKKRPKKGGKPEHNCSKLPKKTRWEKKANGPRKMVTNYPKWLKPT